MRYVKDMKAYLDDVKDRILPRITYGSSETLTDAMMKVRSIEFKLDELEESAERYVYKDLCEDVEIIKHDLEQIENLAQEYMQGTGWKDDRVADGLVAIGRAVDRTEEFLDDPEEEEEEDLSEEEE